MQMLIFLTILLLGTACNGTVKKDMSKEKANLKLINNSVDPLLRDVRCSFQDKEGNIWFGTRGNGL